MTWTAERSSVNQHLQIGPESTSSLGTNVAATKELLCFDMVMQPEGDTTFYRGSGRKYDAEQEQHTEWLSATWNGNMDYNGLIYPLVSIGGNVAAQAHGSSGTAKDWIITPPVTGSIVPRTYTVEQGDSSYAQKVNYTLFTDFGYTVERKATSMTGKTMSQALQIGITLTASPTVVALATMPGKHFNFYADTSFSNLGVTQLAKIIKIQFAMNGVYGQFFPINRANASYANQVDLAPQTSLKMLLEADATALAFLAAWEQGTTYFVRTNAQGLVIDNLQIATITGGPTGGTFTLTYKGQTTAGIAYNATSSAVQTAFRLLSTVPATTTVTGSAGGPYNIVFSPTDTLSQDTTAITASGAGLTGGTSPGVTITQSQSYNTFNHDMAIKFDKPDAFSDSNGVYAIGLNGRVVEDATWGNAHIFTVTNLITAL